jgi:hypothetical protein
MALLWHDSFDYYTGTEAAQFYDGDHTIAAPGRFGGSGLKFVSYIVYSVKSVPASGTIIVGAAVCQVSLSPSWALLGLLDGATMQVSLLPGSDGSIAAYRGNKGTLLGRSAVGLLTPGTFNFIELKATIGSTTGSIVVRVNGAVVLNLSNVNTQASSNNSATGVFFSTSNQSATIWDDLYICDTTGMTCNDFLGDTRSITRMPSAQGYYADWDGSDGNKTDNYLLVDEATPNSTDYVATSTPVAKETYRYPATGYIGATVHGVKQPIYVSTDDAGSHSIRTVCRIGGVDYYGDTFAVSSSFRYFTQIWSVNPATGAAWLLTEVEAAEFGYELVS